jgi:hypothetical protein
VQLVPAAAEVKSTTHGVYVRRIVIEGEIRSCCGCRRKGNVGVLRVACGAE